MNTKLQIITALFDRIDTDLFAIDGRDDYAATIADLTLLCQRVADYPGDNDDLWSIGWAGECTLSDLIAAAHWHASEWHGGQDSTVYALLSATGAIFSPGMGTAPDDDSSGEWSAFDSLNTMAEQSKRAA